MDKKPVTRKSVKSSNINSIGYDPQTRELDVEFRGGSVYRHFDVTPEGYDGLMASDSKGAHYHAHFKNKYGVTRV